MIGFPIDSHVTFEANGIPVFDRAISSEPYRSLLHVLFTDGVLPNVSTNLQVTATTGTTLKVLKGFAMVNGCMKLQEQDMTLQVDTGESLPRIDRVVMRLDVNDNVRACELAVIKGTPASTPTAPDIVRSSSIYDISLANVRVNANATEISNANITDTRFDTAVCGVISSLSQFDTDSLNQQLQAWEQEQQDEFESWSAEQQAEFYAWVETIKNILDDSTAGHLQNEIDELKKTSGGSIFKLNFILEEGSTYTNGIYTLTIGNTTRNGAFSSDKTLIEEKGIVEKGTATITSEYDVTRTSGTTHEKIIVTIDVPYFGIYDVNMYTLPFYRSWLASIGKDNGTYNSLDAVLADEKMVRELMTRHASDDVLSATYNADVIKAIVGNRVAVKWIGLRSYIYDRLMKIDSWKNALLNSDFKSYIETPPDDNGSEWEFGDSTIEMLYDHGVKVKPVRGIVSMSVDVAREDNDGLFYSFGEKSVAGYAGMYYSADLTGIKQIVAELDKNKPMSTTTSAFGGAGVYTGQPWNMIAKNDFTKSPLKTLVSTDVSNISGNQDIFVGYTSIYGSTYTGQKASATISLLYLKK